MAIVISATVSSPILSHKIIPQDAREVEVNRPGIVGDSKV